MSPELTQWKCPLLSKRGRVWELVENRPAVFPRSDGRVRRVHGSGGFHELFADEKMVTLAFASQNQIGGRLRQLKGLRETA